MELPRIYISVLEVDIAIVGQDPRYQTISPADSALFTAPSTRVERASGGAVPRVALAAAEALRANGVEHVWYRDFWDYPTIEETIASCTAMLAVVDAYYFSSTGKLTELCYAAGQFAHTRTPIAPIPIFILPLDESYVRYRGLEKPGNWTIVPSDQQNAVSELLARLSVARSIEKQLPQ